MPFQPFPIYDFRSGLNLAAEPWKTPANAFIDMNNVMSRRGILRKRAGQTVFGQLGEIQEETIDTSPAAVHQAGTLSSVSVIPKSFIVISGSKIVYDDGNGNIVGNVASVSGSVVNTIDYDTGTYDFDFDALPGAFDADVKYHISVSGYTRGIHEFNRYTGSNQLLGFQKNRMSKWNSTYGYFENVSSTSGDYDLWDSTNLVWTHAFNDNLWITDNTAYNSGVTPIVNGVRYFDGNEIRDPIVDDDVAGEHPLKYGSGANDDIHGALIIFSFKERMVFLNPIENSTRQPQRMSWSWNGDPLATDAWRRDSPGKGGCLDAPTNEEIVAFAFFGGIPIVGFENSIWAIDYIGDPNTPFTWRRIVGFKSVNATFSGVEYTDSVGFLGGKGLVKCNGNSADNFDKIIPDFVYDIDLDNINKACTGRSDDYDQIWLAYPKAPNSDTNNAALVFNYEDNAFFKYDIAANCFGTWTSSTDKSFSDYTGFTYADLTGIKWGDRVLQAGYPVMLSGGDAGYVYHLNNESSNRDYKEWDDTGSTIDFALESGRLNPFISEGREIVLQQIGFFVTKLTNAEFMVDFYVDEDLEPVFTAKIDCSTGTGDKMWVFADTVLTGEFVKMRIYMSADQLSDSQIPLQQIEIHGTVLWAKPGARIKQ